MGDYSTTTDPVSDLDYWKVYLGNAEPCTFPTLDDGLEQRDEMDWVDVETLSLNALWTAIKTHDVTLIALFHTAWALVLRSYQGTDDVCFASKMSEGDAPAEALPILCTQSFVCRSRMRSDQVLAQALAQVQADLVNSLDHMNLDPEELPKALNLDTRPLFDTRLDFETRSPEAILREAQKYSEMAEQRSLGEVSAV